MEGAAKDIVDEAVPRAGDVAAENVCSCDRPGDVLVRAVRGAALLVVGSRGHGAIGSLLLGLGEQLRGPPRDLPRRDRRPTGVTLDANMLASWTSTAWCGSRARRSRRRRGRRPAARCGVFRCSSLRTTRRRRRPAAGPLGGDRHRGRGDEIATSGAFGRLHLSRRPASLRRRGGGPARGAGRARRRSVTDEPDGVVVGLSTDSFDYDTCDGRRARFVAEGRDSSRPTPIRRFPTPTGLRPGAGAIVAAIATAAGREPEVAGKPVARDVPALVSAAWRRARSSATATRPTERSPPRSACRSRTWRPRSTSRRPATPAGLDRSAAARQLLAHDA